MPATDPKTDDYVQKLNVSTFPLKVFLAVVVIALIAGVSSGYVLAKNTQHSTSTTTASSTNSETTATVKSAAQDSQTFRDFATGVIQKKPVTGDDYSEGAYQLVRDGQDPVALTSSVIDLSQYVGKKVTVYGETQQAIQAGWLMDVGKVVVAQ